MRIDSQSNTFKDQTCPKTYFRYQFKVFSHCKEHFRDQFKVVCHCDMDITVHLYGVTFSSSHFTCMVDSMCRSRVPLALWLVWLPMFDITAHGLLNNRRITMYNTLACLPQFPLSVSSRRSLPLLIVSDIIAYIVTVIFTG